MLTGWQPETVDKPFRYPERMTDFTDNAATVQWDKLCDYIRNIQTDSGVRLSELVFLNEHDKFALGYYKSQRKKDEVLKGADIPSSERIIRTTG